MRKDMGMKKIVYIFIALLWMLNGITVAQASTSGISLTKSINPRSSGMGGASLAVTDDAFSIFTNPAGLTYLRQSQLLSGYGLGLLDDSLAQLVYANADNAMGTWALGLVNYNLGNFEYLDFNGQTSNLNAGSDWILYWTTAYRFAEAFRFGISLKLLHSEFLETNHATTLATDLGISVNAAKGLRLDLAVKNLGLPVTYSDSPDDTLGLPFKGGGDPEALPLSLEGGAAYHLLSSTYKKPGHDLAIAASAKIEWDKAWLFNAGVEYWYYKMIAVRAGYTYGDTLDGISLGAGLRYPVFQNMPMELDYSLQLSQALNYRHNLALSLDFAPNPERSLGAEILKLTNTYRPSQTKIGFGFGGSYAGPGMNAEFMLGDYSGLFFGIGVPAALEPYYTLGFSGGSRFYFGDPTGGIRGRVSTYITGITGAYSVGAFLAATLGVEWRFAENVGISLDAGGATPLTSSYYYGAVPMADLGLVFHICRDQPNQPLQNDQQENEDLHLGQVTSTIPVQLVPADAGNNSVNADALKAIYLEKFVVADFSGGKQALLGVVFNHDEPVIGKVEGMLTFYDAAGTTLTSQTYDLIGQNHPYARHYLPGLGHKRVRLVLDHVPDEFKSVSLKIVSLKAGAIDTEKTTVSQQPSMESTLTASDEHSSPQAVKLGLGFGTPYGVLGGNFEFMIRQVVGLYFGLGSMGALGVEDMAYQVGLRVYLLPPENSFRFRAGLGYGPAGFFGWQMMGSNSYLHYEIVDAIQPAFGFEWKLSKYFSLDFDAIYQMYRKHDANYYFEGTNNPLHMDDAVKIALGVAWHIPVKPSKSKAGKTPKKTGADKLQL